MRRRFAFAIFAFMIGIPLVLLGEPREGNRCSAEINTPLKRIFLDVEIASSMVGPARNIRKPFGLNKTFCATLNFPSVLKLSHLTMT